MKRRIWSKIDLTDIYTRREVAARVVDVKRVLIMTALTVVAVAYTACLLELRAVRRDVEELRATVVQIEERSSEIGVREMPEPAMPSDVMGSVFLQMQEGGAP